MSNCASKTANRENSAIMHITAWEMDVCVYSAMLPSFISPYK